jgi:two-component system cell cycle response regulator
MQSTAATTVLIILAVGIVVAVTIALSILMRYSRRMDGFDWELGVSYLVKERGQNRGLTLFQKLLQEREVQGLIISRTFPDKIPQMNSLESVKMLWLTRENSADSIDPLSLAKLTHVVKEFIQKEEGGIVLLDGLEYLILHNDYETTLRFIQALNDLIILNKATLIVPVDTSALSVKELSLLEKEMETHRLSMNILKFFGE